MNPITPTPVKTGGCPHGMPASVCPMCSGGGGGKVKQKVADFSAKKGEMSWADCYAIGQMMKNNKKTKQAHLQLNQTMTAHSQTFRAMISHIINITNMLQKATNFITAPIQKITQKITQKIKNISVKVFNLIKTPAVKIFNKIKQLKDVFFDVSDKIVALIGEKKLANMKNVRKRIDDGIKKLIKFLVPEVDTAMAKNDG